MISDQDVTLPDDSEDDDDDSMDIEVEEID